MIWEDNKFFIKNEEYIIYARNALRGAPENGGAMQVLRLPSLKHTTAYNPDSDLIWEYETDLTRSDSSVMRTFSPDVRMRTLLYKVIFILLKTLKLLMNLSLQKTQI